MNSSTFERIQLKQVSAISCILALLSSVHGFLVGHSTYSIFCLFISAGYILHLMMYHVGRDRIATYFVSVFGFLWGSAGLILFGHFFAVAAPFLSTLYISYVLFRKEKKIRNAIMVFNIILFFLVTSYSFFFEPLLSFDNPIDQGFVYLGSLFWLLAVSNIYENEKSTLLESMKLKNEELNRTAEELERFTYIASHDLKSPLRTVISFLGLLEKDIVALNRPEMEENLTYAQTGANQMSNLVNDILEWSFINSKNGSIEREMVDLNSVASTALKNLDQEIKHKEADIRISELFTYECNKNEFIAIFQNIIQNAIKYNESKRPMISIWSEKSKRSYKVYIKDNGIGIEEQYKDQIFEYFKRLHSAAEYEGTGLGLGLCKKIIEKYDGDISVESKKEEEGSTFIITLPLDTKSIHNIAYIENKTGLEV